MPTGIDPRVDYAFKRLFGSEEHAALTADLLNAVLNFPAGKVVRVVELLNPLSDVDQVGAKVAIFDVCARDQAGRLFNLEMQRSVPWSFDKRVLYYWATLHGQQLLQGDYYETLSATVSICFLDAPLYEDASYHHTFRLMAVGQDVTFSKDIEIHVVELSKFAIPVDALHTPLERWCYFLRHGEELDRDSLPDPLNTPVIRQAMEVLMVLSQDERERFRYLDRLKAQRDAATLQHASLHAREEGYAKGREEGLEKGLEQGLEKGLEQGLEQGLEKGEIIGRIHAFQLLLKQPLTPREDLVRRTVTELLQMAETLQHQVLPGENGAS